MAPSRERSPGRVSGAALLMASLLVACCPVPDAVVETVSAAATAPPASMPAEGNRDCGCANPPVVGATIPEPGRPGRAELGFPRPNPGAAEIEIRYDLAHAERVRVGVFDGAGRLVRDLVNGTEAAGLHTATWKGTDDGDRRVAAGIYFVHLRTADQRQTRKLILTRP